MGVTEKETGRKKSGDEGEILVREKERREAGNQGDGTKKTEI